MFPIIEGITMARVRKSHKRAEEETKPTRNGIKPPYRTSKPGANPYVIYADRKTPDDPIGKILVLSFGELYSAHYFINQILEGDTWEECEPVGSRTGIMTAFGIRITMFSDLIWKVIEYEPTELEAEWEDRQVVQRVRQLKYGRSEFQSYEPETTEGDQPVLSKRDRRTPKPPKEPKPKIDKTGMVTANDIAKELGVEGREVRGVLRAMKLEKPQGGWAFDKKTAEEIKDKVKRGLKEKAKKK